MELQSQMSGVKRKHEESVEKLHKQVSQLSQKPQQLSQTDPSKNSRNVVKPASVYRRVTRAEEVKGKTNYLKQKYGTFVSNTDQYEVLQYLGEGSFGVVAKCLKKGTNESVAVKMCKNSKAFSKYFYNEYAVLRQLSENNPDKFNFVRFLDFFMHQKQCCLVFEMLERNLGHYIGENGGKPVPVQGIRSISEQILTALSKLKTLKIIHGDIKPENIMFMNHKRCPFKIKIIDFGVAVRLPTERYPTKLQALIYRAPEVLLGLPYSESIDMWSFGCVLAEMLLGRMLYPGKCEYDQLRYICQTQDLPPQEMLDLNGVALDYFCLEKTNSTNIYTSYKWRLKTLEEYRRRRDLPQAQQICNSGLKTLDDVVQTYVRCAITGRPRSAEEVFWVTRSVDLLKRALSMRPEDRISPEDALRHVFIGASALPKDNSPNGNCQTSAKTFQ